MKGDTCVLLGVKELRTFFCLHTWRPLAPTPWLLVKCLAVIVSFWTPPQCALLGASGPSRACPSMSLKGPSTLATLFNHMWPRIVAGIFIPVGNHYFQALASTLQFVAQVCDRLWLVPATDRAFAYITYMSP